MHPPRLDSDHSCSSRFLDGFAEVCNHRAITVKNHRVLASHNVGPSGEGKSSVGLTVSKYAGAGGSGISRQGHHYQ